MVQMFQNYDSKNFSRKGVRKAKCENQGCRKRSVYGCHGQPTVTKPSLETRLHPQGPHSCLGDGEILSARPVQLGPHSGWRNCLGVWAAEERESIGPLGKPQNTPTYPTIYSLLCCVTSNNAKHRPQRETLDPNIHWTWPWLPYSKWIIL